jgi:hypothetical protein
VGGGGGSELGVWGCCCSSGWLLFRQDSHCSNLSVDGV